MRYLIVSDTHGRHTTLGEILESMGPIEGLIHLGDSQITKDSMQMMVGKEVTIYSVRGNCDHDCNLSLDQLIEIAGKKIFLTHGHRYHVDSGTQSLEEKAKSLGAEIVMYGHTHRPDDRMVEGLRIINPGSLSKPRQKGSLPTYMLLEIDQNMKFHWTLVEREKKKFF